MGNKVIEEVPSFIVSCRLGEKWAFLPPGSKFPRRLPIGPACLSSRHPPTCRPAGQEAARSPEAPKEAVDSRPRPTWGADSSLHPRLGQRRVPLPPPGAQTRPSIPAWVRGASPSPHPHLGRRRVPRPRPPKVAPPGAAGAPGAGKGPEATAGSAGTAWGPEGVAGLSEGRPGLSVPTEPAFLRAS